MKEAAMMHRPTRTPGTKPAMNSAATETLPATTAYTIMMLLGGMMSPVVADVAVRATEKSRPYPFDVICGIMKLPIDDTAATAEPDTAPNIMHVVVVTYASPPGRRPTSAAAR